MSQLFEENAVVTTIQEDPNYFFRYARRFSICKTDIGPFMTSATNSLSNDKHEMCRLLVDQFTSVYHSRPQQIITDPFSFFAQEPNTDINKSLFFNRNHAKWRCHNWSHSQALPKLIRSRLCSFFVTGQLCYWGSPVLLLIFSHSLSHGVIPKSWKRAIKSGNKTAPSNYRPISLTSVIWLTPYACSPAIDDNVLTVVVRECIVVFGLVFAPRPILGTDAFSVLQGVCLAVTPSPVAIGNVGGLLEGISMVAHRASGNKIDNIMVVREFIIFCVIKHHSGSPITIGNLIW